jgi:hypothetical protein
MRSASEVSDELEDPSNLRLLGESAGGPTSSRSCESGVSAANPSGHAGRATGGSINPRSSGCIGSGCLSWRCFLIADPICEGAVGGLRSSADRRILAKYASASSLQDSTDSATPRQEFRYDSSVTIPGSWGLSGLTDDKGQLDRPVAWNEWDVPDVVLQGDRLTWSPRGVFRRAKASSSLLEAFVGLADAVDAGILNYARRWGVFGICRHGLPASHNPPPVPRPILDGVFRPMDELPWCYPRGWWGGCAWEPLDTWRAYARKFRAVLNVAAGLHDGRRGTGDDWRELNVEMRDGGPTERLRQERVQLCTVLNQFLAQGRISLEIRWDETTPTLRPRGSGLFGAVLIQLVLAVGRSGGFAICAACGIPFIPARRPRPDQRHYCERCRKLKVPARDAAADYRRRRRAVSQD